MPRRDPEDGTATRVLARLRAAGAAAISGEALARELGVTRAAVWKSIEGLRGAGFSIDAAGGRGYRLTATPDRIRADLVTPWLTTSRLGRLLVCHESTGSTMNDAAERARAGDPEGTVVVAETQTSGRGRLGRAWHSPERANLYFSVLLRPPLPAHRVGPVTLVAGLALARAIARETGVAAAIKWPNDLVCGSRKLAGILAELAAEPDRVHHLILGVGINVNAAEGDFPAELRAIATSLAIESGGRRFDRARLLAAFLADLEAHYDRFVAEGLAPFLPDLEASSAIRGRIVRMESGSRLVEGRAVGIATDGALLVETATGEQVPIHSGEIALR